MPFRRYGTSSLLAITPAMSRWAQWGAVTNSFRNAAAVHAPPALQEGERRIISKATPPAQTLGCRLQGQGVRDGTTLPAVLPNVTQVCERAICYLFCVMFKKRHSPYPVPCHDAGLKKKRWLSACFCLFLCVVCRFFLSLPFFKLHLQAPALCMFYPCLALITLSKIFYGPK